MHSLLGLALFGTIGTPELIIILILVLLLFGASKLPQLGGAIGKTIKNFKSEMREGMTEEGKNGKPAAGAPSSETRFCHKCGNAIQDDEAAFCPKCGTQLT